ncbi:MAG TPA: hypothetical protein DD405_06265 [Desulfobacteraceae bacterium]|nr:hypothetical protein [Desulfobacteraceae bacterium]
MKKKWFKIGLIILLATLVSSIALAADQQEILNRLDYLQDKLKKQQEIIEQLKKNIEIYQENVAENIEDTVYEKIAKAEPKNNIKISRAIDSLKLQGDLRLRYEYRDRDKEVGDDDSRDRMRTRFRLGGIWVNSGENWEVAAGLATGDDSATSTNDTWSKDRFFETGDIRLDYAYAKHKLNKFTFTAGQQKNPFKTTWLLWDSDVRPAGFTANYDRDSFFITAGGYDVMQYGDNFGSLYAGQMGSRLNSGNLKILLALAYYDYDGIFEHHERPNKDYEFNIADLYLSVKFPVDKTKFNIYGQVFNNFGADGDDGEGVLGGSDLDPEEESRRRPFFPGRRPPMPDDIGGLDPEDESLGWVIGLDTKIKKIKLGYSYLQVGADSCVGGLKDQDFGDGVNPTDIKGHKVKAGYNVTDHFSVGITALFYEALELDDQDKANLYQMDMKYKF